MEKIKTIIPGIGVLFLMLSCNLVSSQAQSCRGFTDCAACTQNSCQWCNRYMYSYCTDSCDIFNCFLGECVLKNCEVTPSQERCIDTDYGENYYMKGTCYDKLGNKSTDYCSETGLIEYSCGSDEYCHNETYNCSSSKFICKDGACIQKPSVTTTTVPSTITTAGPTTTTISPLKSCKEECISKGYDRGFCYPILGFPDTPAQCPRRTTDVGQNGCFTNQKCCCYTLNSTTTTPAKTTITVKTTTPAKTTTTIVETTSSDEPTKTSTTTPPIVEPTTTTIISLCYDTDGGKKYELKGICSDKLGNSVTDYCSEDDEVVEYYCNRQGYCNAERKACYSGQVCQDGRCVGSMTTTTATTSTTTTTSTTSTTTTTTTTIAPSCKDTDGGKKYDVQGTCTDKNGNSVTDYCSTERQFLEYIVEYYCDTQGYCSSVRISCPRGQTCQNGACSSFFWG